MECQQGSSCCVSGFLMAIGGSCTHVLLGTLTQNMKHELQLATKVPVCFLPAVWHHWHLQVFPCAKEEHYATFRAELEAIIHAQDVEDGNLTAMTEGRKNGRCCGQGFWDKTHYSTVRILSSRRLDSLQLYQPVQLHAADYTTYKPISLQLKQLHPHLYSCRELFHPTQFFSGYEAIRRADVSVESLATPGGWDAIRIVRLEP